MSNRDFQLPIKGYSLKVPSNKQPPLTTGYMDNIYPFGTLEGLLRLVQRPGTDKAYAAQIGGAEAPTVVLLSITTVD